MAEDTFITYTHPIQLHDKKNRHKVASYIGTHFRNRSKPANRKSATSPRRKTCTTAITPSRRTSQDSLRNHQSIIKVNPISLPKRIPRDTHGLRNDPFNTYPIHFTSLIPGAVDYFISFYAPTHLLRPEQVSPDAGIFVINQYFRYAMQNPLMFEALVALSHASLAVGTSIDHLPDPGSLHHYGQALRKLREALNDVQSHHEDALLFAISALMGIDYLLNDLNAFQLHLHGIRQIVALRGGIDKLGWPLLLKPLLKGLEAFWTYICSRPQLLTVPVVTPPMKEASATYHLDSHKAPDDLNRIISELPPGIAILARQQRLSIPVISLAYRVYKFDSWITHLDFPTPRITRYGEKHFDKSRMQNGRLTFNASNLQELEYAARLLGTPRLTYLERVCCIAMLIVCISSTKSEQATTINKRHLQFLAEELLEAPLDDEDPAATDLYVWTSLNLARTMVPGNAVEQMEVFPKSNSINGSGKTRLEDDKRFQVVLRIWDWIAHRREHEGGNEDEDWERIAHNTRNGFIWSDGCIWGQKWAWDLARDWKKEHPMESVLGRSV